MEKAKQRIAQQKAREAFGRLAEVSKPVDDPLTELAKLAGDAVAWKEFLARRIADVEQLAYRGMTGEQIEGEIQLWNQALSTCNTVLATIARLDIDERLVRIEQGKADMFLRALEAGLAEVGLTGDLAVRAKQAAVKHLRVAS